MTAAEKATQFLNESCTDLSDETKAKMQEIYQEAVDAKAAELLGTAIEDFITDTINERAEELIAILDSYLEEELCIPFEQMQEEHDIIREENTLLHDWLDTTIRLAGLSPEEVVKKAAERARRNAASSASSYSDTVAVDNSAKNRASIQGRNSGRGVNGMGDYGGIVKEDVVDPRVAKYVDYINRQANHEPVPVSLLAGTTKVATNGTMQPQQLSESEIDRRYEDIRRGQAYGDAIDALMAAKTERSDSAGVKAMTQLDNLREHYIAANPDFERGFCWLSRRPMGDGILFANITGPSTPPLLSLAACFSRSSDLQHLAQSSAARGEQSETHALSPAPLFYTRKELNDDT
jgi:hypothetical protein